VRNVVEYLKTPTFGHRGLGILALKGRVEDGRVSGSTLRRTKSVIVGSAPPSEAQIDRIEADVDTGQLSLVTESSEAIFLLAQL